MTAQIGTHFVECTPAALGPVLVHHEAGVAVVRFCHGFIESFAREGRMVSAPAAAGHTRGTGRC